MKIFFAILTVLSVFLGFCSTNNGVVVSDGWAPAAAESTNGQVYFSVENPTQEADTLVSIDTTVADSAQLSQMELVDGVYKPQPVNKLTIAPGKNVHLTPTHRYVVLNNLKQPLVAGATIHLKLNFEKTGTVDQSIQIQAADTTKFEE